MQRLASVTIEWRVASADASLSESHGLVIRQPTGKAEFMFTSWYQRLLALSSSRKATWWMAGLSFTESSVFFIPPDLLLVPMCVAQRQKAMWFALVCTLASVGGGVLGYYVGRELFHLAAVPILEFYDAMGAFETFKEHAAHWGFLAIALKGLTPIPYKVVAIAVGAVEFGMGKFILASIIGRGSRFFLIAWLCQRYGDQASDFMERHGKLSFALLMAVVIGGIFVVPMID